jgi:hypothetical protein
MLETDHQLETEHLNAWRSAHHAEEQYLAGIKEQASHTKLAERATYARDRWTVVSTICALAEDGARSRVEAPPIKHWQDVLTAAWRDVRNWAVLGEDAAARGELFGALASAHVSRPPTHEIIRLYAEPAMDSEAIPARRLNP